MRVGGGARRVYGPSMLELASYMKGDTCATKEGRGEECTDELVVVAARKHKKREEKGRKKKQAKYLHRLFSSTSGL